MPREQNLILDEQQDTLVGLIRRRLTKEQLANKIADIALGATEADREQVQILKTLFDQTVKEESVNPEGFGLGQDSILRAAKIAVQDVEFLRVIATAIAERRQLARKSEGRVRPDIFQILVPKNLKGGERNAKRAELPVEEQGEDDSKDFTEEIEDELSGNADTGTEGTEGAEGVDTEELDPDLANLHIFRPGGED